MVHNLQEVEKNINKMYKDLQELKENNNKINIGRVIIIGGNTFGFSYNQELYELSVKKIDLNKIGEESITDKIIIKYSLQSVVMQGIDSSIFKKIDKAITKLSGHKLDEEGNIYLISDGYHTKIGATTYNIQKRLNELQTGNSRVLSILGYYNVKNKISTETYLHSLFEKKHILGEWFILDGFDIKEILDQKHDIINTYGYTTISKNDIQNILQTLENIFIELVQINNKQWTRSRNKRMDIVQRYTENRIKHQLIFGTLKKTYIIPTI